MFHIDIRELSHLPIISSFIYLYNFGTMKKLITITLTLTLALGAIAQAPSVDSCLVRHLSFDGHAKDSTKFGNDLTNNGATLVADRFGKPNAAYHFIQGEHMTGTTDDIPIGIKPRTVSMWLYLDIDPDSDVPMMYGSTNKSQAYGFAIGTNIGSTPRGFRHAGWGNDHQIKYDYPVKEWFLLVGSYDGDSARLYVDGVKIGTSRRAWNTASGKFLIGKNLNGMTADYFNGSIDDIKVYNCALTDSQVKQLLSVNEVISNNITISPNPTSGLIHFDGQVIKQAELHSSSGQLLMTCNDCNSIDLSVYTAGVFYLNLRTRDNEVSRRKILKF
jgi:hypothetical protein